MKTVLDERPPFQRTVYRPRKVARNPRGRETARRQ
jgi:hypothetical protein